MDKRAKYEKLAGILTYCYIRGIMMDLYDEIGTNYVVTVISIFFNKGDHFPKKMVDLLLNLRDESLEYFESMTKQADNERKIIDLTETWKKHEDSKHFKSILERCETIKPFSNDSNKN